MSLHPLLPRRNIAAWLGALCFFLMLAALLDGIIAGGRKDPLINEVVPGESIKLSGPMPRDAERLDQLWLRAADPAIGLALEEVRTGFWLGGQQWQAEVTVPAQLGTGDHIISLSARNETSPKMTQTYTLRVFASPKALKDASLSLTTSTFGISPFFLAIIALHAFTAAYGNFMFAFITCQDPSMWTIMVNLYQLQARCSQPVQFASLVLAALPTFVIFATCQKVILRGIVVPTEK